MSTATPQKASTLEDYLDLFRALADLGLEVIIIGGCAVGAYARLLGETTLSDDLDLLVSERALETILSDVGALGLRVEKLPSPRAVPVAVLSWKEREINLLTSSDGLSPVDVEARVAREFPLGGEAEVIVLVADPFDLLRNKRRVNRPKDRPHMTVLRRFLDEEVAHAFATEQDPRARLAPADRLLEVLEARKLDEPLASRLVALARTPADFRFLAHRVPNSRLLRELIAKAPSEGVARLVEHIASQSGVLL